MEARKCILYFFDIFILVHPATHGSVVIQHEDVQLRPTGRAFNSRCYHSKFGYDVDICGKHVVVGSPYVYLAHNRKVGSATVFTFNGTTWDNGVALVPGHVGDVSDGYGISVAVSNIYAAVTSPYEENGREHSGAVYVYRFNEIQGAWVLDGKLLSDNRGFRFGHAVALDRDIVTVGSPLLSTDNPSDG